MRAKSSSFQVNSPPKKENSSSEARNFSPPLACSVSYTFSILRALSVAPGLLQGIILLNKLGGFRNREAALLFFLYNLRKGDDITELRDIVGNVLRRRVW